MRKPRCYCQDIQSHSLLDETESGHLCRVLRVREGSDVELIDGKGTLAQGRVLHADKKRATIEVGRIEHFTPSEKSRLVIMVSFAKGQRFDWLVEKCTELGADHIAAILFDRSVKQGSASGLERYRKIAIAAAKQSKRLFFPEISGPEKLARALDLLKDKYPESALLYGRPEGAPIVETAGSQHGRTLIVVVGPEGGFSENEIALLDSNGGHGVSVNQNILRIETAAVGFCAVLNALRG